MFDLITDDHEPGLYSKLVAMPLPERLVVLWKLNQRRSLSGLEESLVPPGEMPEHYRRRMAQYVAAGFPDTARSVERDWLAGGLYRTQGELWGPHMAAINAALAAERKAKGAPVKVTKAEVTKPVTTSAVTTSAVTAEQVTAAAVTAKEGKPSLRQAIKALGARAFDEHGHLRSVRMLGRELGVSHVAVVKAIAALDKTEGGWRKAAKAMAPVVVVEG